tara:strand:+ start:387 stop:1022 length:636 start_codon:yes stop_codon:yes gene_type:complete
MKIGVFGDSYTEHAAANPAHLEWWQYVQQSLNIKIDTYGYGGSSLYYTWKQFHTHQHKYDKVIVCLTKPNRLWMPHLPEDWQSEHVHTLDALKHRTFKNPYAAKIMKKALISYYKYIVNLEEQQDIWKLQITDIKRTRPDGLYLACFPDKEIISDYMPLFEISKLDGNLMGTQRDTRANHFNDKNCKIFAKKIETWIQTNQFSLDIEDFSK